MEHPRHHGPQADRSEARLRLAFRSQRGEKDGQLAAGMEISHPRSARSVHRNRYPTYCVLKFILNYMLCLKFK